MARCGLDSGLAPSSAAQSPRGLPWALPARLMMDGEGHGKQQQSTGTGLIKAVNANEHCS